MKVLTTLFATLLALAVPAAQSPAGGSILFIGNSFTFADGSPVRFYRADTVTDLNGGGIGGVPALVKSFTQQAGLSYDVFLETRPGVGLDWHLANRRDVLTARAFDTVVMHGYSTLDADKPRDPAKLVTTAKEMAALLRGRHAAVTLHLMATWPRADQTYPARGAWAGQPIQAMARDVRAAYDQAAAAANIASVIPVGEAWTRAMDAGVADPNPYDGIDAGKLNLWTYDHYHGSTAGYYLEALVVFGSVTGRDPRWLGRGECSAFELGLSAAQTESLQKVAFDQLVAEGKGLSSPARAGATPAPARCAAAR